MYGTCKIIIFTVFTQILLKKKQILYFMKKNNVASTWLVY